MPGCAGQAVAAEELVDKFVPRDQFVLEAEELLEGAIEVQQDLERGVQSGYKTLLAHLRAYLVHLLNIQHLHS
jgi:hypothetical protein